MTKQVNSDPNLSWCPNETCQNIISIPRISAIKILCSKCKTRICKKCRRVYHKFKKCENSINKQLNEWVLRQNVGQCSKCNMLVEKRSGCNHMTCPICGYQWCWLCGAAYTTLHFSPLNILGCPGLQSGRNTKKKWSTTKRYFNMFGRLLIYLLLFPFALLFGCPVILVVAINEDICYLYCRDLKRKYFFL